MEGKEISLGFPQITQNVTDIFIVGPSKYSFWDPLINQLSSLEQPDKACL